MFLLPIIIYAIQPSQDVSIPWFRDVQLYLFVGLTVVTLVVGLLLMYRLRTKMFLYYLDFNRKLWLNLSGVLILILFQTILAFRMKQASERNEELSDLEASFLYYAVETVSSAVMFWVRITDDLFVQLNRQRTLLRISIFQYDHLSNFDLKMLAHLKSSGDTQHMRS